LADDCGYNVGAQNFFATAGGQNPDGISKALERVQDYLV
jgi:alanyl-tRNA synthetase